MTPRAGEDKTEARRSLGQRPRAGGGALTRRPGHSPTSTSAQAPCALTAGRPPGAAPPPPAPFCSFSSSLCSPCLLPVHPASPSFLPRPIPPPTTGHVLITSSLCWMDSHGIKKTRTQSHRGSWGKQHFPEMPIHMIHKDNRGTGDRQPAPPGGDWVGRRTRPVSAQRCVQAPGAGDCSGQWWPSARPRGMLATHFSLHVIWLTGRRHLTVLISFSLSLDK